MDKEVEILEAMIAAQRQKHLLNPQRPAAKSVAKKRAAPAEHDGAESWEQRYQQAAAEIARLRAEMDDMVDALQTSQELERENDELRALADGLAAENDALRCRRRSGSRGSSGSAGGSSSSSSGSQSDG